MASAELLLKLSNLTEEERSQLAASLTAASAATAALRIAEVKNHSARQAASQAAHLNAESAAYEEAVRAAAETRLEKARSAELGASEVDAE